MTVSLRFENSLNSDLDQMCTNLVPYPRIHFPTSHHAPMQCKSRIDHELSDEFDLTRALFTSVSQFVKVDCSIGKLMACVMQYRGNVSPKNVNRAIFEIKRRNDINFVDWCPTGFKVGINSFPPTVIPSSSLAQTTKSVTMLCNTTAICQMWEKLNQRFDFLFAKRAFVHWFVGEGMEEGEFSEGRDSVESIIKDYHEAVLSEEEFANGPPNEYNEVPIQRKMTTEQEVKSESKRGSVERSVGSVNDPLKKKASYQSNTVAKKVSSTSNLPVNKPSMQSNPASLVENTPAYIPSQHSGSVNQDAASSEPPKNASVTSEQM